jgi:hypothetical protein
MPYGVTGSPPVPIHVITRGQFVNWDAANNCVQVAPVWAAGVHAIGIALSDGDPDLGDIAIGVKDYTVAVLPEAGYTPATGYILYPSAVTPGCVSKTAGTETAIGWVVNAQLGDPSGDSNVGITVEMGTLYF